MTIPLAATIRDQIISYVASRLGGTIPYFSRGFVYVVASAVAGVLVLAYRFVAWCLDQTQPATCNEFWLGIWESRYGMAPNPAVAAELILDVTGVIGSTIPASTLWATASGVVYQQLSEVTTVASPDSVYVRCLTFGTVGNLADGSTISLVSPVAGIDNDATVDSTTTPGIEKDTVSARRAALVARIAYPPQGGAIPDYVNWALEVPGIVAAFVDGGGGDVVVYPLVALTGVSRVPSAPKLAEVLAYLTDPIRKPMGANITAPAATERTCAVTITTATINGVSLTSGQKAIVQSAVDAYLYAAYPRQYPDEPSPTDTISEGPVWAALVAIGASAASVTLSISGIGGGPYVLPIGEIIKPSGVITWA